MKKSSLFPAALALFVAACGTQPGSAADLGVAYRPIVVTPAPVVLVPVLPHVWLGHFTGGARTSLPGVMDWRDEFARFGNRRSCLHWLRALTAGYHAQEGFKTCLPIR